MVRFNVCLFASLALGLALPARAIEFDTPARISGVTDKNAAAEKKSIHWVQGSTHAYVPPKPHQVHDDAFGR